MGHLLWYLLLFFSAFVFYSVYKHFQTTCTWILGPLQCIDKHITKYRLLKVFRKRTLLRNYAEAQSRVRTVHVKTYLYFNQRNPCKQSQITFTFLFQNNLGLPWRNLHCQDPSQWNRSHGQFTRLHSQSIRKTPTFQHIIFLFRAVYVDFSVYSYFKSLEIYFKGIDTLLRDTTLSKTCLPCLAVVVYSIGNDLWGENSFLLV